MDPTSSAHRRTVLFVDVVASTALYADLGDVEARGRMAPCLHDLQGIVESHEGVVVKSLGDGILAAFEGEAVAVEAALNMAAHAPSHGLQVRVGVHIGDVLLEDGDMFGQAVNTASRMTAMARPSEVLVTRDIVDRLPLSLKGAARRLQEVAVKGLSEPLELFALGRDDPAATTSVAGKFQTLDDLPTFGLELRLGERTWTVGPLAGLTMGRDPSNDLVVDDDTVSRHHASIAVRRGKYLLVDESVNGTWLVSGDASRVHLLRDETTLVGIGQILLGVPPEHPGAQPITYRTVA